MMKRAIACLLAMVCLLTGFAFAEGISMKVIKVNTAVNLRKQPTTDSESLALVPKGTVVTDCILVDGTEWYSVNFDGIAGFIRGDFLEAVKESKKSEKTKKSKNSKKSKKSDASATAAPQGQAAEGTPLLPAGEQQPAATPEPVSVVEENVEAPVTSFDQPTEYNDDFTILDTVVGGVRVIARQIYQETQEYMMVVGLDASNNELWKKETTTDAITELMQTDVFVAGTQDAPLVMLYNACRGLAAINPATGDIAWELYKEDIDLGGSISYAVDGNGILYVGGYYGPDPVAIAADGTVLWQASSGAEAATWMYRLELRDDGIACAYGSMAGENSGTIVYDYNGALKDVIYD